MTISDFANAQRYDTDGWSGHGRPTRQQYREKKRHEAEERQAAFDREVRDVAQQQNCHPNDARYVVNVHRRLEHRLASR